MNNSNGDKRENVFEIMDNIMHHLNKTKNLFLIMILTVLILPPLSMLIIIQAFDSPFSDGQMDRREMMEKFRSGEGLTPEQQEEMKKFSSERPPIRIPQLIMTVISLIWLGVGLRQWFVISKWSKKYKTFKEQQEKIDKNLDDGLDEESK